MLRRPRLSSARRCLAPVAGVAVALVATARGVRAQRVPVIGHSLEVAARAASGRPVPDALQRLAGARQGDAAAAGGARIEWPHASAEGRAELPLAAGARPGGRLATTLATPSWRGIRALVAATGVRNAWWADQPTWHAAGTAQLAWSRGTGGAWLGGELVQVGAASGSPWLVEGVREGRAGPAGAGDSAGPSTDTARAAATRMDLDARRSRQLAVGAWRRVRGVVVSAAVRGGRVWEAPAALRPAARTVVDSLTGRDLLVVTPGVRDDSGQYARRRAVDTELRLSWTHGRLALGGGAGMRRLDLTARRLPGGLARTERRGWGAVDATLGLGRGVALTATAGAGVPATDVAGILAGAPAARPARYALLGVRLAARAPARPPLPPAVHDAPSALELRADGAGRTTVRVRVAAARVVELAGDFTGWRAVAMRRADGDVWEATVEAARGTHRLSIRVDGDRWTAPPGLPPVHDDFGGSAAVVVVP
jgi:hypothetical protein